MSTLPVLMTKPTAQASLLPAGATPAPPSADHARVFDALAFAQAPLTVAQLIDLIELAGLRTARGSAFHANDVRLVLGELARQGHAVHDERGRWSAERDAGWLRFRAIVLDEPSRELWWRAWREQNKFDRGYHMSVFDSATYAGAMRVVVHCGRSAATFNRLGSLVGASLFGGQALREALLAPFDGELLARLDPPYAMGLASNLLAHLGGDVQADEVPLLDWLLECVRSAPGSVPEPLHYRLAETLLFRQQFTAARSLLARLPTPESQALGAGIDIAEGRYAEGAARYEAALKTLVAETGRRKHLLPQSIAWLYAMALLAQPEPASWVKARKFVAAEAGKRGADPSTFWGLWQSAIDQRLGDAARSPSHFLLTRMKGYQRHALEELHHLLLAAWLRMGPGEHSTQARLREHAAFLETRYRGSGLQWLAALVRRSAALLLGDEPAAEDAALPFFIGAAQDRWREALAAIVALGAGPTGKAREAGAPQDRLIWTVRVDEHQRIVEIAALEQKANTRGLGKVKPVTLATLVKRKDLPAHDAAVLRAAQRASFGNRPYLNLALAAPALVRHPHVAWSHEPERFIEVAEALPALEVMTRGEHITFKLVDPVQVPPSDDFVDDDDDDDDDRYMVIDHGVLRSRVQAQQTMLIPDGSDRARLVRLTPAQLRVAELVTQGWQVPASAKAELDAALRVLAAHFQLASDAEAGHKVPASSVLHAELTPQGAGLNLSLMAAPFGDFGPRLAPGAGRERVATIVEEVERAGQCDQQCAFGGEVALGVQRGALVHGGHALAAGAGRQARAEVAERRSHQ